MSTKNAWKTRHNGKTVRYEISLKYSGLINVKYYMKILCLNFLNGRESKGVEKKGHRHLKCGEIGINVND